MEFSTLVCCAIALLIVLASSQDIEEMHVKQRAAMTTLKAWQKLNKDKEQQK